jgi:hypothetical protein
MKKFLTLLLLSTPAFGGTEIAAFYDPNRQLGILEHSFFYKSRHVDVYGFNEFYRNDSRGFPRNENVWFGKTWVMHNVSSRWSVGLEIEHGRNNAGMYAVSRPFTPDKMFVLPKVGFKLKLD